MVAGVTGHGLHIDVVAMPETTGLISAGGPRMIWTQPSGTSAARHPLRTIRKRSVRLTGDAKETNKEILEELASLEPKWLEAKMALQRPIVKRSA